MNPSIFEQVRWQPPPRSLAAVGGIGSLTWLYSYGISRLAERHTDAVRGFVLRRLAGLGRSESGAVKPDAPVS